MVLDDNHLIGGNFFLTDPTLLLNNTLKFSKTIIKSEKNDVYSLGMFSLIVLNYKYLN